MSITFEITDTKSMSVKTANEKLSEYWSDHLTYKGIEFFDSIYLEIITKVGAKCLNPTGIYPGMADLYLGYLPDLDVFVSAYELYDDDDSILGNVVFIKVIGSGNANVTNILSCVDTVFNKDGAYQYLKKNYSTLVDIMLD